MSILDGLFKGLVSGLTITNPPLYRYPYRNSGEAFRADWKRIGGDIESSIQTFEGNKKQDE